ncbi:MAG: RIP metalloprotease RseP [Lachnospiraceae bacterium]|nr:RIP metalloprotease RseP [Lachnospiraceae bacterium]
MGIVLALIVFSILILFHELGHFLLAKKNGIGVTEFSLGLGPRLVSHKFGETRYSIKLLPFGGSCAMLGEDEDNEDERAFNNKSVWARMAVIAAGPIFNFILAFVAAIIVVGVIGYDPCIVTSIDENSPLIEAGLEKGDIITEVNGVSINVGRELYLEEYVNPYTDEDVEIKYLRDGKEYEITVPTKEKYMLGIYYTAKEDEEALVSSISNNGAFAKAGAKKDDIITKVDGVVINNGKELMEYFDANPLTGEEINVTIKRDGKEKDIEVTPRITYELGFTYNVNGRVEAENVGEVLKYSFVELKYGAESVFKSFQLLFTGKAGMDDISGPVGIVDMMDEVVEETKSEGSLIVIMNLLNYMILFSVNLGILNLVPFPALDGGRLFFLIIEAIRRKPISREKEGIVNFVGLMILMVFMVYVMFNDIMKIF